MAARCFSMAASAVCGAWNAVVIAGANVRRVPFSGEDDFLVRIEKEIGEYLSKKYGQKVKIISSGLLPMPQSEEAETGKPAADAIAATSARRTIASQIACMMNLPLLLSRPAGGTGKRRSTPDRF